MSVRTSSCNPSIPFRWCTLKPTCNPRSRVKPILRWFVLWQSLSLFPWSRMRFAVCLQVKQLSRLALSDLGVKRRHKFNGIMRYYNEWHVSVRLSLHYATALFTYMTRDSKYQRHRLMERWYRARLLKVYRVSYSPSWTMVMKPWLMPPNHTAVHAHAHKIKDTQGARKPTLHILLTR